jgi:hypothetical protein
MGEFIKGWKGKNERGDDCEIVADCLTEIYPLLVVCTKPTGIVGYYQSNKAGKNDYSFLTSGHNLVSNRHPAMDWPVEAFMWYEKLNDADRAILNKLAGRLNLPSLCKYQSNAHFLSDVYSRISETHSLVRQANRLLGGA